MGCELGTILYFNYNFQFKFQAHILKPYVSVTMSNQTRSRKSPSQKLSTDNDADNMNVNEMSGKIAKDRKIPKQNKNSIQSEKEEQFTTPKKHSKSKVNH